MSHSDPRLDGLPPEAAEDDRHHTIEVKVSDLPETIELEKCKLVVVDGPDRGVTLTLTKPIIRIGTNEKNDLLLQDNTVSRFHCEISETRGRAARARRRRPLAARRSPCAVRSFPRAAPRRRRA